MAKQTFTTGQVLTAAQMTSLQQTAMGGGAASAKTASYVLVAADAGTAITMTSASSTTITVNTGLFAAGDTVQIINLGAGICTITAGTATVSTAGSLALSQYESGWLYFTATGTAVFNDYVQAGGGGGKVLQVVQAQSTTATTIASTTYTDTTLTASITPSASTSKVLVIFTQVYYHERGVGTGGASESGIGVKLLRDSTDILALGGTNADKTSYIYVNAGANSGRGLGGVLSASYLDSPATTSSTTYKTQGRLASTADGATSSYQPGSTPSTMLLLEIGA